MTAEAMAAGGDVPRCRFCGGGWGDGPVLGWRRAGEAPVCSVPCGVKLLARDAEPAPARDVGLDAERVAFPVWGWEGARSGNPSLRGGDGDAPPQPEPSDSERWSERMDAQAGRCFA